MTCSRFLAAGSIGAASVLVGWPAWALTQPSGASIPWVSEQVSACSDNNVQACLDEEEGGRTIDAAADAHAAPETFDPRCNLTFHILNRGASYADVFGWYNVRYDDAGRSIKPDVSELYTFILGDEEPPFERTLDLRDDPNYAGGEIGFFIATGFAPQVTIGGPPSNYDDIFFSEREHNPAEPGAGEPSVHLLIWQSVTFADSFYFGWEDLLDPAQNDNDFDDIFTRVSGIQCAGGGGACDTGRSGVCRKGTLQCQRGELACMADMEPSDESCNALDDDCDGEIDEGEELCPTGQICDRGKCVPRCGTGEFRCREPLVCNERGACVERACLDVTCGEGEVCTAGTCVDGCDGVKCPYAKECRLGRCVDPCEGIRCDEGYTCRLGVCESCACGGCGKGESCVDNVCVEDACASVSCSAGTHCADGECVDDCAGAVCPGGAACRNGECQAPDDEAGAGDGGDAVVIATGGSAADQAEAPKSTAGGSSERNAPADIRGPEGCACRSAGRGAPLFAGALAVGLGALYVARRRRRRAA